MIKMILLIGLGIAAALLITAVFFMEEPVEGSQPKNQIAALLEDLCDTFDGELAVEALAEDDTMLRSIESYSPEQVTEGKTSYGIFCANCHGAAGEGEESFGPPLKQNVFTRGMNDEALLRFIIHGRPVDDPFNISGVAMPPRGGFPSLTDDQIRGIIAYIRVLDAES